MKRPIYLDYAATTPVDPKVLEAMLGCLSYDGSFGNPGSSTHLYGWQAKELVDTAREKVASAIGAVSQEIIFTSGATEANNLAIQGYAYAHANKGKHIVTSLTEHKSVLEVCQFLASKGYEVTYLKPDENGLISEQQFTAALRPDTILCSIMLVNNETGVVQPIAKFSEIARARGIAFHTDAVQAPGKIEFDINSLNVDMLSLSAHKVYGPKGVGALYLRRRPRVKIEALLFGGDQENGLRAGTLSTHQIVGMGEALCLAKQNLAEETLRLKQLKMQLWQGISSLPAVYLNGNLDGAPGILNVSFAGVDGEALLMALSDIAVSSGSACTSATIMPSHVLIAMGRSAELAHSTIRFSLGRYTSEAEISQTVKLLQQHVSQLRSMSPLWRQN
jgi:cysteine desulfurase